MLDLHMSQYTEVVRLLKQGVQTFLLVGTDGVGKKTLVRRVLEEQFPDINLVEIQKLGIDEARQLKRQSISKSVLHQTYLIDGDHATGQAYNALLKLLEEPPVGVVFFIAASKVPVQTIVSRCNFIIVPPLSVVELKLALTYKGMSERAAFSVVPQAHGSISEAFRVYEKLEEKRRLISFIRALKERDVDFVFRQVKTIDKADIALLLELINDVLLSRYGLLNPDLSVMVPATLDFVLKVKEALSAGKSPSLCWLRAYFATG